MPRALDLSSLINSTTYPSVPSIDELEALRNSIKERRASAGARVAQLDPATAESIKNARKEKKRKEKEQETAWLEHVEREAQAGRSKDKGRDKDEGDTVKVKRERSVPSNVSATSGKPIAPLPTTYTSQHKKKKQKKILDSDDEQARATPTSPPHATQSGLKVRLAGQAPTHAKSRPAQSSQAFTGADEQLLPLPPSSAASVNVDFSLPTPVTRPLIPPRPGVAKPPKPGPKKQSEVQEDYSNVKAPSQIALPTFWNSVEPYLREIREDDLAMLGFKATALDSMDIPARGRHYSDVWDEEDGNPAGSTPRVSVPNLRQLTGDHPPPTANGSSSSRSAASTLPPAWAMADLSDAALSEELRGLGSISERLVAAVIPDAMPDVEGHKRAVQGVYGQEWEPRPGEGLAAKINARELEERVKKELRGVMLLGERDEFDPSKRDDDEITSSLRQCQRLLEAQISLNEARKARLVSQAKNRLAYAEYQSRLDGVEKGIEAAWAKRVKKHGLKNKQHTDKHGHVIPRPPIPEQLKALVKTRQRWLYGTPASGSPGEEGYTPGQPGIGQLFKQLPLGQVRGLPTKSIYEGLEDEREEEEVQAVLNAE